VPGFLCLNAVGYTSPILFFLYILNLSLLIARSAFRRLDHLWLISNLKLLLRMVESIVGWICCNKRGAFRRLGHIWLSLARALAVSHLLSLLFFCSRFISFFPETVSPSLPTE
jgi:hypothetical protein